MCGIAGIIKSEFRTHLQTRIELMTHSLIHRGPDSSGFWIDDSTGVAFGHRRLSILDLSSAGSQPMISSCGRFILTFNGEIYNHKEIRLELGSLVPYWKGHSDTETLLAAFSIWGIEATLPKIVGMFAFGLWDCKEQILYLCRDRFGEKPLYYGWTNGAFLFASELKAIKSYPEFANPICRIALAEYLRFMYVPAPLSIYKNIYKLEPGCLLILSLPISKEQFIQTPRPEIHINGLTLKRWWVLSENIDKSKSKLVLDEKEVLNELAFRLKNSVRQQSLTDVPFGAFLSGGIDSSTIVALMQNQTAKKIKSFTIGFDELGFDEAPYAQAVARHLGTEHHEIRVSSSNALEVIPSLSYIYDEPFADSSQIPTYIISKAAKGLVTVALSGDGGDEVFGGYNRYFWSSRIWNKLSWLPLSVRRKLGQFIHTIPIDYWDYISKYVGVSNLGDKSWKLAKRLENITNLDELYWSLVTEIANPENFLILSESDKVDSFQHFKFKSFHIPNDISAVEKMMYYDTMTYLPDDILCKVDRASMASGLETRCPFLDHRVVEFAWQIPINMKIKGVDGKQILKKVLYKYVPRELIDRPKAGFAIPIGKWLCGPLKDWAESLIDENLLKNQGYFQPAVVRQLWVEHQKNQRDHTTKLWAILMFQSWVEVNENNQI